MVKTVSQVHSSSPDIHILARTELRGAYCSAKLRTLTPTALETDPCFRDYEKLSLFQQANVTYIGNRFFIGSQMR